MELFNCHKIKGGNMLPHLNARWMTSFCTIVCRISNPHVGTTEDLCFPNTKGPFCNNAAQLKSANCKQQY